MTLLFHWYLWWSLAEPLLPRIPLSYDCIVCPSATCQHCWPYPRPLSRSPLGSIPRLCPIQMLRPHSYHSFKLAIAVLIVFQHTHVFSTLLFIIPPHAPSSLPGLTTSARIEVFNNMFSKSRQSGGTEAKDQVTCILPVPSGHEPGSPGGGCI